MSKLMKCGHVAQGIEQETSKPICVICAGIHPGASEVDEDLPSLEGRMAVCSGCKKRPSTTEPSSWDLPFFKYHENYKEDSYYCGCWGWN